MMAAVGSFRACSTSILTAFARLGIGRCAERHSSIRERSSWFIDNSNRFSERIAIPGRYVSMPILSTALNALTMIRRIRIFLPQQ